MNLESGQFVKKICFIESSCSYTVRRSILCYLCIAYFFEESLFNREIVCIIHSISVCIIFFISVLCDAWLFATFCIVICPQRKVNSPALGGIGVVCLLWMLCLQAYSNYYFIIELYCIIFNSNY